MGIRSQINTHAATFGWLCVETYDKIKNKFGIDAATFGWLCVETLMLYLKL